jgi:hypothetical protein
MQGEKSQQADPIPSQWTNHHKEPYKCRENWQFCIGVQNSSIITKTTLCRCLMFSNNPGNKMITCPEEPLAWKGERERERERKS